MSMKSDLHYVSPFSENDQTRIYRDCTDDSWHMIFGGEGMVADAEFQNGSTIAVILSYADQNPELIKKWFKKHG